MSPAISPAEAASLAAKRIPEEVLQAVNSFLEGYSGATVVIEQSRLIERILSESELSREQLFEERLLDFEALYRAQGWQVHYDRPGYSESYGPRWLFSAAMPAPGSSRD